MFIQILSNRQNSKKLEMQIRQLILAHPDHSLPEWCLARPADYWKNSHELLS